MSSPTPVFHLVIHSGYQSVFIGLYDATKNIAINTLDKKTANAFLVSSIAELLNHHEVTWGDLAFIGVHSGPAPFTTLRIGIATANGLAFATQLPLVPVNGLVALSNYYPEYTVLLNAFCDDLYIGKKGNVSCQNSDLFLQAEKNSLSSPMTYIGNGVSVCHDKIKNILGDKAFILEDYPYEASVDMIAQEAYSKWQEKKDITKQVTPTYLKEYSAKLAS